MKKAKYLFLALAVALAVALQIKSKKFANKMQKAIWIFMRV